MTKTSMNCCKHRQLITAQNWPIWQVGWMRRIVTSFKDRVTLAYRVVGMDRSYRGNVRG